MWQDLLWTDEEVPVCIVLQMHAVNLITYLYVGKVERIRHVRTVVV